MARVDDVFIILLAINRVLSMEELSQLNKQRATISGEHVDPENRAVV